MQARRIAEQEIAFAVQAGDVVPAKAEVVAAVWIYTNPQQLTFDARTGETTPCVLIVPINH